MAGDKKQKIILFDIDYTLYDVGHFYTFFYKKLSVMAGVDEDIIKKRAQEVIEQDIKNTKRYSISRFITRLLKLLHKEEYRAQAEHILFKTDFLKGGFYQEVEEVLIKLKKIGKLGIFSQGDIKFQKSKLQQSGFHHFFEKDITYIFNPRKLAKLAFLKDRHVNDELYLIDDKPSVIYEVKKYMPFVFTIWIKRGKYIKESKNIKGFNPDAVVKSLSEIIPILKSR